MKTPIVMLFIIFSAAITNVFAQDVIVLKSGDEIKSKVLEITPTEIKYKKFDNLEGPTIVIVKSDVFMIKYANGTKDVMTAGNSSTSTQNEIGGSKNPALENSGGTSFFFMPLGFLEFGPVFGAEFAAAPNLTIDAHLRIPSLGLLSYAISGNSEGDLADHVGGIGIGTEIKYYSSSIRNGYYFGGLVEYISATAVHYKGADDETDSQDYILALAFVSGYRFQMSQSVYVGV